MKEQDDDTFRDLLQRWNEGDRAAMAAIAEQTYDRVLIPMAIKLIRKDALEQNLTPAELVAETWERLARTKTAFTNRAAFFAYVKQQMTFARGDIARKVRAKSRGGSEATHYSLDVCDDWMNA